MNPFQVRTERNMARDEAKQLRASLEIAMKESNSYKREKHELELQIQQLKKEMEKIHMCLIQHAGQHKEPERDISGSPIDQLSNDGLKNVNSEDGLVTKARSFSEEENGRPDIEEYILQGAMPKEIRNVDLEEKELIQRLKITNDNEDDADYMTQKVKMLHLRLEDAHKAIQAEKE